MSLEELILRHAAGWEIPSFDRVAQASGVMMIPIPKSGVLKTVQGVDDARAIRGVDGVSITAKLNYPISPLPEGSSYLGFIFARGEKPEYVELALRQAHEKLKFEISPNIVLSTRS